MSEPENSQKPLVSCLCVSKPDRWGQLQRALADFCRQTYANRELIVVVDQRTDYAGLIDSHVRQELEYPLPAKIKIFPRQANAQLEALQFAMMQARGDLITFWDDDNQNNPERLAAQVQRQLRFPDALTAFSESGYYFHETNELFLVNYEKPDAPASERCAVSTLMGPRDIFPPVEAQYRAKPAEMMVNALSRHGRKLVLVGGFPLYHVVGVTHDNLRGYDRHRQLAQERGRAADWITRQKDQIGKWLDALNWDVDAVDVVGSDAKAFSYDAKNNRWPDTLFPIKAKDEKVEQVTEAVPEK